MLETEEGSEKYRFQSSELPFVLLRVFERYHFERQGIFPMKPVFPLTPNELVFEKS